MLGPVKKPVDPSYDYSRGPVDCYESTYPITIALAKYYYEREWSIKPIRPRGIEQVDMPYFGIISRFEVDKGDYLTVPIGYMPGDLPSSEELRRVRFDYGENRMAGPLAGKGELWIMHPRGKGAWSGELWILHPPGPTPRWRKAEVVDFSPK